MSVQRVLAIALAAVGLVSVVGAVTGSPVHMGIVLALHVLDLHLFSGTAPLS